MKKMIIYAGVLLLVVACNMKSSDKPADAAATPTVDASDNPYTLNKPYMDWQAGDQKNAMSVLKMIKAWETKNLTECATYFGDSVEMSFDYSHKVLPHDSMPSFLNATWENFKTIKVNMQDWESVISADKTEEWVTVWYKQITEDKTGKMDSVNLIDDMKLKAGKIMALDEYTMKLGTAPKK